MTFVQPWVWLLAATVALPVAIHMLERDRSRRVVFPSLRFVEATRLSAVRRRRLQDLPLLVLRCLMVLMAVAALAGPIVVTPAREAAWARRVARAVVLDDRTAAAEDELRSAAVGATFARARLGDALRDAVRWLDEQEPVAREIVVLSAFRRQALTPADLDAVPSGVGVRLVRTAEGTAVRERQMSRIELRDEGLVRVTERLTLAPAASRVEAISVERPGEWPIRVTAPAGEQARADAALRAVLRRGVRLPPAGLMQPLDVEWPGDVNRLAAMIDARLATPLDAWEPETMSDDELHALSRPVVPTEPARPEDMGDRRWAWAIVLALLAGETWFRKGAA